MNPIYRFFILRPTANLLDPGMAVNGYRLNTANGKLVSAYSSQTSDYMPVEVGAEYATKHSDGIAMQMAYIVFYNKDYGFVSGASNVNTATAPAGAAYARVTFAAGLDLSEYQFAASSQAYSAFVSSRVFPVYKNDVAIDYALQQGEEFYRGTLSGKFTFESADYDFINTAAFDKKFEFEIRITYDGGQNWKRYWFGKFYKTDCEFNEDDKTVIVTPALDDVYNDVLAGLEKEYDLIKLAPEIVPIKYDKRPMLQFYVPGASTISCYLSGMWWEQECEASNDSSRLFNDCKFYLSKDMTVAELTQTGAPTLPRSMFVASPQGQWDDGYTLTAQGHELVIAPVGSTYQYTIRDTTNHTALWQGTRAGSPIPNFSLQLSPVTGSGATGTVDVNISLWQILSRLVTSKATADTAEIGENDIVPNNRNYKYIVAADCTDAIIFNSYFAENPTEWGLYQPGYYYSRPNAWSSPIGRKWWGGFSMWLNSAAIPDAMDEDNRQPETLKDACPIASVISVLLGQFAPNITHQGTTDYSRFLYGETDPLTFVSHHLFITPKSNILTAGYDQPAQTAKITLRMVLDMLRDCFRCYWFIDEQKRFRIEHIEFFRRGGSYSLYPEIGLDLTQEIVTRNGKPWAFGRNQFQFEKPAMAERYQFGWMDDVTQEFEGQPIDIISGYVEPGNIENITVNQFTSDVDYMLLNPGACSKDGFALLSAVISAGEYMLPYERFEDSRLQNGQLCWPYLQIYYVWDMPARYYKIGTQQYTASGVKKLKTQSLKFPVLKEPDLYKLIKTDLGDGTIQKLSVNLSSRNANATLKYEYDTE